MTLDDIAALEALWAEANQDTPWQTFEAKDGSEGFIHLCDNDGAPLAWVPADDAGRCNGLFVARIVNALPALLALARRGLEADARPDTGPRNTASPTVRHIVGPTILLAGGTYFDLLDPENSEFTIADVARGLSNTCRFAGQSAGFYSVAEHAVHVSRIVPPEDAYAGLMHDAAEAFIGDVSKPLKDLLPEYRAIERRIEAAVFARFGVPTPMPASVKGADVRMLAAEQHQVMRNRDGWGYTRGYEPAAVEVLGLMPDAAMALFLDRYAELRPVLTAETVP